MRRQSIERLILVVLLITALLLWLPLVKWHRLFDANPQIAFSVPLFDDLPLTKELEAMPALPHLVVIRLGPVAAVQTAAMQAAGYPAFVGAAGPDAYVGPYLNAKQAQSTWQQMQQRFKMDATIQDYVMGTP